MSTVKYRVTIVRSYEGKQERYEFDHLTYDSAANDYKATVVDAAGFLTHFDNMVCKVSLFDCVDMRVIKTMTMRSTTNF